MIEEELENDMTYFFDIDVNAFRVEFLVLKKEKNKSQIEIEGDTKSDKDDLWTLFFMVLSTNKNLV